jgi:hypothetical protein
MTSQRGFAGIAALLFAASAMEAQGCADPAATVALRRSATTIAAPTPLGPTAERATIWLSSYPVSAAPRVARRPV